VRIAVHRQPLRLTETFTIARASVEVEEVCVVTLEHQGITAFGEGAPVDYWGEFPATIEAAVQADAASLIGDDPLGLEQISRRLADWDGPQGAKMALDGALHDYLGKYCGQPLWRMFGLGPVTGPTSFTIGISDVADTVGKIHRAPGAFGVFKVKVGGASDLERLEAIRSVTDARLRIDGNEGWTLEVARELTPRLLQLGIEFVEQPFPADDLDSYHAYGAMPERLPVLIDEGCKDLASVEPISRYADGIVIKLSKCGGIREAHRMIHAARALGLDVMLGCMIESQLGISQAAQLAPLVDHIDLDGHLLIRDEPFVGLGLRDGCLILSDAPGLGVVPTSAGSDAALPPDGGQA
jgi:L-alanine-DL-glutamate epimerase-like enolase superfamily enzyme